MVMGADERDFYKILDVEKNADSKQIKSAFKK
jgi:DnaJ-class molecular chaperone